MNSNIVSLAEESLREFSVVGEEHGEELLVVQEVDYSAGLTDAVHGEASSSNVDGLDASLRSHHRADC